MKLLPGLLCSFSISTAFAYEPQTLEIGSEAPDFKLQGIDDKAYTLADFSGGKATAIIFTTNHCPDAITSHSRMVTLVDQFKDQGVKFVAINSNSPKGLHLAELGWTVYDDGFEDMKLIAKDEGFNLPYLFDGETQEVAKAYGAVATPHIFIFDSELKLQYEGRMDSGRRKHGPAEKNEARDALTAMLKGETPAIQSTRPVGCTIKWMEKAGRVAELDQKWKELPVEVAVVDAAHVEKLVKNEGRNAMRLFNIWSTSCGPCVQEFPDLTEMHRQFSTQPFEFIPISLDPAGDIEQVTAFLKEKEAGLSKKTAAMVKKDGRQTNNLLFDGDTEELAKAFPKWNGAMPYTVLVGPEGEVLYTHSGIIDPLELKKVIVDQIWKIRG